MIASIVAKDLGSTKKIDEDKALQFLKSSKIPKKECNIHGDSNCLPCQKNAQSPKNSHSTIHQQIGKNNYKINDSNCSLAAKESSMNAIQIQPKRSSITIMTSLIDRIREIDEQSTLLRQLNNENQPKLTNRDKCPSVNRADSSDSLTVSTYTTDLSSANACSDANGDAESGENGGAKRVRFDFDGAGDTNEVKIHQVSHSSLLFHLTGTDLLSNMPISTFECLTDDKSADKVVSNLIENEFCFSAELSQNHSVSKLLLSMFSSTNLNDFSAISEIIYQSSFEYSEKSKIDNDLSKLILLLGSSFKTAIYQNNNIKETCKTEIFETKIGLLLSYLDIHLKFNVAEYDLLLLYKMFKSLIVLYFDESVKKYFELTLNSICFTLLEFFIEVDIDFVNSIYDLSIRELHVIIHQLLHITQSNNELLNFTALRNIICQISFRILDNNMSQCPESADLSYFRSSNENKKFTDKSISKSIVSVLKMMNSKMNKLKDDIFFIYIALSTLLVLFTLIHNPTDQFLYQVHQSFLNIDSKIHDTNKSIDNTVTKDMMFSFNFMIENTFSLFLAKKNSLFPERGNFVKNIMSEETNILQQKCHINSNAQISSNEDNEDELPSI